MGKKERAPASPRDPDDVPASAAGDHANGGSKEIRRSASLGGARARDREMDKLPRKPERPRQWKQGSRKPQSTFCARIYLVVVNAASLIFGALILFFGTKAFVALKGEEDVHGAQRPLAALLAGGAVLIVFSVFGLLGACCAVSRDHGWKMACCSNRLLMAYFVGVLLLAACLFFAAMLCFLFVEKAAEYVGVYWAVISEFYDSGMDISDVNAHVKKYSKAAGGMCIGGIFLNFFCAHLSARVMGYKYTTRRTLMIINIAGFILGVVLIIIAFVPATQEVGVKGGWLPQLAGSMGVFVAVMSLIGFSGAYWSSIAALGANGCIQSVLGVIVLVTGSICLADAKNSGDTLASTWMLIKYRFVDLCPTCTSTPNPDATPSPSTAAPTGARPAEAVGGYGGGGLGEGGGESVDECCRRVGTLLVWSNLTLLGVALSTILVSILVNAFSSFYLFRTLRRDRMSALDDEEVMGLRGGPGRGGQRRADRYRYGSDDD